MEVADVGGMNAFDAGFAALVFVLSLVGLAKGFTRLVVGMTALVAAFLFAAARHAQVAAALVERFEMPPLVASGIGYGAVFIGVMLGAAVVLPFVRALVRMAMLGWADRLAGAVAALAGAVLIAGSVVVPVLAYVPAGDLLLAESQLAPYAVVGADAAVALAPAELAGPLQRSRSRRTLPISSLRRTGSYPVRSAQTLTWCGDTSAPGLWMWPCRFTHPGGTASSGSCVSSRVGPALQAIVGAVASKP